MSKSSKKYDELLNQLHEVTKTHYQIKEETENLKKIHKQELELKCTIITDLKSQLAITEKALELVVEELDDAKDMLRDAGKNEWASLLNTSVDYFKVRAKEMLENE